MPNQFYELIILKKRKEKLILFYEFKCNATFIKCLNIENLVVRVAKQYRFNPFCLDLCYTWREIKKYDCAIETLQLSNDTFQLFFHIDIILASSGQCQWISAMEQLCDCILDLKLISTASRLCLIINLKIGTKEENILFSLF